MEEYAHRKNIERFERDLASESDPLSRERLKSLLENEHRQLERVLKQKGRQPR